MNSSPNSDRSRLARELHDGLAQELAAVGYKLDSVIGRDNLDQSARNDLRRLRSTITALIEQVRNEIYEMRSNSNRSFAEAVRSQLETLLSGSEISFTLQGECEISKDDHYELIRCIRELILNSISHSNCMNIQILLTDNSIIYSDDGLFHETSSNLSFGLTGISERLSRLGGQLNREASTFTLSLPAR
jgi:two-component system, NarL family, sensor histidine kinase LiaS